jgi:hypothetical protein
MSVQSLSIWDIELTDQATRVKSFFEKDDIATALLCVQFGVSPYGDVPEEAQHCCSKSVIDYAYKSAIDFTYTNAEVGQNTADPVTSDELYESRKKLFEELMKENPDLVTAHIDANEPFMFDEQVKHAMSLMKKLSVISKGDSRFYAEAVDALKKTHSLSAPLVSQEESISDDKQEEPTWWARSLPEAKATLLAIGKSLFHHEILLNEARAQLHEHDKPDMTEAWSLIFDHGGKYQPETVHTDDGSGFDDEWNDLPEEEV